MDHGDETSQSIGELAIYIQGLTCSEKFPSGKISQAELWLFVFMPSQSKVHHKRLRKDIHISPVDCYKLFLGVGGGGREVKGIYTIY